MTKKQAQTTIERLEKFKKENSVNLWVNQLTSFNVVMNALEEAMQE